MTQPRARIARLEAAHFDVIEPSMQAQSRRVVRKALANPLQFLCRLRQENSSFHGKRLPVSLPSGS